MPQLAYWADRQPEKIAAHFPETGEAITYGQLYARARQVAHWLIGLGLRPGTLPHQRCCTQVQQAAATSFTIGF